MKKFLLISFLLTFALGMMAQDYPRPVRTPEEEALKQTEMLSRELSLSTAQYDTIYRIHLKYAILRQQSNTRQEALERLNAMSEEVLNQLTPKQRQLFLNKQMDPEPFRPRVGRLPHDSVCRPDCPPEFQRPAEMQQRAPAPIRQ